MDTIYVPDWTFADKFRKARMSIGMEQREFAAALDLTPSTVAAYETGRSAPRFRAVPDLAKRLQLLTKIDYRWFLDVGGSTPPDLRTLVP
ncbi:helix-turn-helix domain-containing protein [Microbacterium sp. NIBRBAC000506063]|uniref:helix-turn-helix domain-containing protein n=1 Tax=Microbacterium sp. NIBRBAC000506063 TaxID=2734618 RepID=UPI001BB7FD8A|nr:helix-turn-helix transcriptional regulator [Microbacterium sp. NIBRBAC000506063]QTV79444.1 helix-turn-helix transcriptional regulator [Microbacterium sp. NIBRBAC000506063]